MDRLQQRLQAARRERQMEEKGLEETVKAAEKEAEVLGGQRWIGGHTSQQRTAFTLDDEELDCPRPAAPRDTRLHSPTSTPRRAGSASRTSKRDPNKRHGVDDFVGVDFSWSQPGGWDWQLRMKAEGALLDINGDPRKSLFAVSKSRDKRRSVRYLASKSALRSRHGHACDCYPDARRVPAPTTLRDIPRNDILRRQLTQRPFRTYMDFLHHKVAPPPVPLP